MISLATRVQSLLVVAPHPDDETIGAWQLIRRTARAGKRVTIVVASDGNASHPGSKRWPPARLAQARRRETLRAMRELGLATSAVHFLNLPDGELADHKTRLRGALARIIRHCRPALIVGPVTDDAHSDHRAVAEALSSTPRAGERRLGYQVWPANRRRRLAWRVRLNGMALAAKRRAVRSYRTQAGIITDATGGFTLTNQHLRAFVRPEESFAVLR